MKTKRTEIIKEQFIKNMESYITNHSIYDVEFGEENKNTVEVKEIKEDVFLISAIVTVKTNKDLERIKNDIENFHYPNKYSKTSIMDQKLELDDYRLFITVRLEKPSLEAFKDE